jgi:hypothetical protein
MVLNRRKRILASLSIRKLLNMNPNGRSFSILQPLNFFVCLSCIDSKKNYTPWPESASELYRPRGRRLLAR